MARITILSLVVALSAMAITETTEAVEPRQTLQGQRALGPGAAPVAGIRHRAGARADAVDAEAVVRLEVREAATVLVAAAAQEAGMTARAVPALHDQPGPRLQPSRQAVQDARSEPQANRNIDAAGSAELFDHPLRPVADGEPEALPAKIVRAPEGRLRLEG